MYWEPCRRHCIPKLCDLEQVMSSIWGLVTGKPACHMGTCCKGRWQNAHEKPVLHTHGPYDKLQPAIRYMAFFVTPDKTTTAREGAGTSPWAGSVQLAV